MKRIVLGVAASLVVGSTAGAGEIVAGKTCDYRPQPFVADTGKTRRAGVDCDSTPYGEGLLDRSMGGDDETFHAEKVVVMRTAKGPPVLAGCERGREQQVLVVIQGASRWIWPRYLDCP